MLYSYKGDTKKAIEQLELFSQQDNYDYWVIVFLKMDPLMDNIKDLPEFKKIFSDIENKFWKNHKQIIGFSGKERFALIDHYLCYYFYLLSQL